VILLVEQVCCGFGVLKEGDEKENEKKKAEEIF